MLCMSFVCHAFASVHCCLVVTCWERADILALVCDVLLRLCHFPMVYPWSCGTGLYRFLWSPAGKGLTMWLLFVMLNCVLSLSHGVSLVSCGTGLYRFLIFAAFHCMSDTHDGLRCWRNWVCILW